MPILTPEERLGSKLANKYRLDRVLGKGGFGVVFAGVHEWTGREIAAKVLNHDLAQEEQFVRRFLQEARSAAKIAHPNVVDVLDMGKDPDGTVYLVLELLRGEDLKRRLRKTKSLDVDQAIAVLCPVMEALAIAHDHGIVHRDLKPDNIFLSIDGKGREVPKLLDFGIAKTNDGSATHTTTGMVMGTPHYMSPEQANGMGKVGPAADVWSMGVVFWACLTGTLPFDADSPSAVLAQILTRRAPPIRRVKPSVPKSIAATIDRALSWESERRYPDMRAFLEALEEAAREPRTAEVSDEVPIQSTGPMLAMLTPPPEHGTPNAAPLPSVPTPPSGEHGLATPASHRTAYLSTPESDPALDARMPSAPHAAPSARSGLHSLLPAVAALVAIGGAVASAVVLWPSDPDPPIPSARAALLPIVSTERSEAERGVAIKIARPEPAAPAPSVPAEPSASERARECSAEGDHRCVIGALEEHAESAADLVLLIEAYRAVGNAAEADRRMRSFVERYPSTQRAAEYRQLLERTLERARPARRHAPAEPSRTPIQSGAPRPNRVGANRAPILH